MTIRYDARGRFDDVAYFLAKDWSVHEKCSNKTIAQRLRSCAATVGYWLRQSLPPSARAQRRNPHAKRIAARRRLVESTIKKKTVVRGQRFTPKRRDLRTRDTVRLPFGSTARAARELKRQHPQMKVSKTTVWRDCKQLGLKAYTQPRGPRLSADNVAARLLFAKALMSRRQFWSSCFSDEKWFDSDDGGRTFQWLRRDEHCLPRQYQRGGPRVMVWACIAPGYRRIIRVPAADNGTGSVKIDAAMYTKIIRPALIDIRDRGLVFQQDNAPGHTKATNGGYFKRLRVKTLADWPPNSPDLSPIETMWAIIAKRVTQRAPFGEDELWKFVEEEFANVGEETVKGLLASFETRLRLCAAIGGGLVTNRALAAQRRKAK
jgi:transposase